MEILTHEDVHRREMALTLLASTRPPLNGLSPEVQQRMWDIIERVVVPELTKMLIMASRTQYGCGRSEVITEPLRVRPWPGGPQDIQTLTVLQFMLDRIVDHHALRDYFTDGIDHSDNDRLKAAFTREIEHVDSQYRIVIHPRHDERGLGGGHVDARLLHTLITLEQKPAHANSGPNPLWRL